MSTPVLTSDALLEARRLLALASGHALSAAIGRGTGRLLPELERHERWPHDQMRAWQAARLAELVEHALRHVPYYRERLSTRSGGGLRIRDMDELSALPVLSKDDVRDAGEAMFATDRERAVRTCATSGSTGRPLVIAQDRVTEQWVRAAQRRAFRWFHVDPLEPRVFLLSAPQSGRVKLRARAIDLATGRRLFQFHDLSPERMREVAAFIREYRPSFVTAYPSVLHRLCWVCAEDGIDLRDAGVRLLHTQSEALADIHVESFRRVFGDVPVLNEYGCVEVGAMAHSCPHGRLHPAHDSVVVEVVDDDGRPVGPGESGRVLLTPLHARAMPLLRYDVGDRAVLAPEDRCPCGRFAGLPLIERLDGRTFDRILGVGGRVFSGGIVHFLVRKSGLVGALREYLAVQREIGSLHFDVVVGDAPIDDVERRLGAAAREVFGDSVRVTVEGVRELPAQRRKKRAYFISELAA